MKHLKIKDLYLFFLRKSFFQQFLIIIFFFTFVFLIWFFLIFDHFASKLEQINNEISILQSNKILLSKLIKQKEINTESLKNLNKKLSYYITDININELITNANNVGLELVRYGISDQINDNQNEIKNVIIPLNFKGTFSQVLKFLESNFKSNKVWKIEKINITKFKDNLLNLEVNFKIENEY